jgi:hypothetical protein
VLISLVLQPRNLFIHQLRTLREELVSAVLDRLVNLKIKFLAQIQKQCFAGEYEILDQNPDERSKEYGPITFIPPSLTDRDEYWNHIATKCFATGVSKSCEYTP